ncbi:MAG: flagellar basal body-associated FliL family protein [Deltaproteobacteria bacterium]|jgi:flagellar FliL protein|nr:flagellar basal body-associated FliL family protein [Deltaproteobacteria bacterium]
MLFLVPDADNPEGEAPAAPVFKVELDLEDAPFLQEPVAEKTAEPSPQNAADEQPADDPKGGPPRWRIVLLRLKANKKKLLAASGACLLLGLGALAVNFFLFSEEKPAPAGPTRVVLPSQPQANATEQPPVYMVNWEPFMVEQRGEEGEIRFLYCRFTTPTDNPILQSELEAKKVVVRDAIYYYLSNKPLTFLSDLDKQQSLKADIISVINEHVSSAKLSELYFEEYMVRGS